MKKIIQKGLSIVVVIVMLTSTLNVFADSADMAAYDAALVAVTETDYTTASWSDYQTIVSNNIVTEQNTQLEVNAATDNIIAAQSYLVALAIETAVAAAEADADDLSSQDYITSAQALYVIAYDLVYDLPGSPEKDAFNARLVIVQTTITDAQAAETAVAATEFDVTNLSLQEYITPARVLYNTANELVTALSYGATQNGFNARLEFVRDTITAAETAFDDAETAVAEAEADADDLSSQEFIDSAQALYDTASDLVYDLPESGDKDALNARLVIVLTAIDDAQTAEDAVLAAEADVIDLTMPEYIPNAQALYDTAYGLVNALSYQNTQIGFNARLEVVRTTITDAQNAFAETAVAAAENVITDLSTQELVDGAQLLYDTADLLVYALPESTEKDAFITRLDTVQTAINDVQTALNAVTAAEQAITDLTSQELIDNAQSFYNGADLLVSALPGSPEKDAFNARLLIVQTAIDDAQTILDTNEVSNITAYDAALSAVIEANYTTGTWTTYQGVVTTNIVTVENTQAQVNTATDNIIAAQSNLIFAGKAALITAKANANALNSGDYTLLSWGTLTNALALPEITNNLVVTKTTAINTAISALVLKANLTVYNVALSAVIEADYTTASWTIYQGVLTTNIVTVENTQLEVNTATDNIVAAQSNLIFAGQAALITAKANATALNSGDYTPLSWGTLTNALALPETTNNLVVAKTTAINTAISALVLKANLTVYNVALSAVIEADYTTASWTIYQGVLTTNIVTVENTQLEVNTATDNIVAAQSNLIFAGKAALITAKANANALNSGDYTLLSWGTLTNALALPEITNNLVVAKTTAINTAITGLVIKSKPSSGGEGGGSSISEDNCPNGDNSPSYYDGSCGVAQVNTGKITTGIKESTHGVAPEKGDMEGSKYTTEVNDAYLYAYGIGITNMPTIQTANIEGNLTRSHMAKMMVNYVAKTTNLKVDETKACRFGDTLSESKEMKGYIKLACQLGIMGVNMDEFNPNGTVTRAEFGTVLSRILYGTTNEGGDKYYTDHLKALKTDGIITNDTPTLLEQRGYLMLMLMRAKK